MDIVRLIIDRTSGLELKLRQANMPETPEEFIRNALFFSLYVSFTLLIVFFLFFSTLAMNLKILIILFSFPIIFLMVFNFFYRQPEVAIAKLQKEISKEIVFAGRFLMIELDSGVSLYNSMKSLGDNYESVGRYFREIIDKVSMGTTLEDAINEAVENVPSNDLRKIMWQILNSLKTGSDISQSLSSVLDQVVREQEIAVREYGRKLNPLAMFYMMFAVIIPSLGTTMLVVLSTFMGLQINFMILMLILLVLAFVQFMFIGMIKSSRPPIDI